MKCLVYTCVFDNYDWIFPPTCQEQELSYVIVTDDPTLNVSGWKTLVVDISGFANSKKANLHYRAFIHRVFKEYDFSLYVDGNIRLLGPTREFFSNFSTSNAALGLYRQIEFFECPEQIWIVLLFR